MSTERESFYDKHPFDWVAVDRETKVQSVISRPLVDLIESLDSVSLIFDIGCGPGRVLGFLVQRGLRCIGIDRSRVSIDLATSRYRRPCAVADNLHLPLADAIADVVISDGVIHHTENPSAAFAENLRILKHGGQMYLGVYKASGRYPFLYKYPGSLVRSGLRSRWSRPLVVAFFQVPYFLVHFFRSGGKRTWTGARNLFYDYFVTPRVAFLSRQVVEEWCAKQQVRIARYDENRGRNVHSFILEKQSCPKNHRDPASPAMKKYCLEGRNAPHE